MTEPGETYRTDVSSDEVLERDPVCVCCGKHRSTQRHHRKLRSQGGLDTWDNSIGVCVFCHIPEIHDRSGRSRSLGLIVPAWDTPSTVPLDYPGRGRVLLGTDRSINELRQA